MAPEEVVATLVALTRAHGNGDARGVVLTLDGLDAAELPHVMAGLVRVATGCLKLAAEKCGVPWEAVLDGVVAKLG